MLSIYIHIPFCLRKCDYCSFVSLDSVSEESKIRYLKNLQKEITLYSKTEQNKNVKSIFIGGGTPTTLTTKQIFSLIECVKNNFDVSNDAEITIEANPSTNIDFENLRKIGFNRISIGIQSFNDAELNFLGRLHSSDLGLKNIKIAQHYFENINIDLIYSVPNQTLDSLKYTLQKAIELDLKHISAYSLIYENETKLSEQLSQNKIIPINEELDFAMYMLICSELEKHDLQQYEVSNFAKNGFECKHNLNYWERENDLDSGNYLGFGLAAHSLYANKRFNNYSDFSLYCSLLEEDKSPIENVEFLDLAQEKEEKIFLGLRSTGVDLSVFNEKQLNIIKEIIKLNYGEIKNNKIILNSRGKFICDEIVLKLIG